MTTFITDDLANELLAVALMQYFDHYKCQNHDFAKVREYVNLPLGDEYSDDVVLCGMGQAFYDALVKVGIVTSENQENDSQDSE